MFTLTAYVPLVLLIVGMAIGVPLAYRAWREAHEEGEIVTPADVLSDLEEAYVDGEIDEVEFRRIRELVLGPKAAGDLPIRPRRGRDDPLWDDATDGPADPA